MSQSDVIYRLSEATRWLQTYEESLSPYVVRSCGVGSVRRQKQTGVHDLEILLIPLPGTLRDLFGNPLVGNRLDEEIERLAREWGARLLTNGPRKKRLLTPEGPTLEILISSPTRWAVEMVIETGDKDFSHKCVTKRRLGGYLPSDCGVKDGWQVYRNGKNIPLLEEADFLMFLGFPGDLEPARRNGKLHPAYARMGA
jgi:DNA polymerase/3'-5' exonuclease PolX